MQSPPHQHGLLVSRLWLYYLFDFYLNFDLCLKAHRCSNDAYARLRASVIIMNPTQIFKSIVSSYSKS